MALTVNTAFDEFMRNSVNLDPGIVSNARTSRDNLIENIAEFDDKDGFFDLCDSFNVHFGSFARKTKCRELDDIDLMIGIAASGATYYAYDSWDNVRITASSSNDAQVECTRSDGTLNSTQVLNRFRKKLENVREYSRSEIHRNGEAVTLNLTSKDWSFDIVPCFHTVVESNGRSYYLIPNGNGNWKKTDPKKDRDHVINTNQEKNGRVLELIRLCKWWNGNYNSARIPSYILETMIINQCDNMDELSQWIDMRFRDSLKFIADHILLPIEDMKEIQGDINTIDYIDRLLIKARANECYDKACAAIKKELDDKDHHESINKWREIFGEEFPAYG